MSLPLLYKKSPVIIQNLLINIKGFKIRNSRFGKGFKAELDWYLKNSSNRKSVELKNFQNFIIEASKSPFWNDRFNKFDIDVNSTNILDEIKKLPILTKEEVKQNIEQIVIKNSSFKLMPVGTSGTTGSGLKFYQTQEMENKQWAVWWRYRIENGINLNDWMAWFGGRPIVPMTQNKPPYWRTNYPLKQLMFSAHHLNEKTVYDYHKKLLNSKIKWLHGYPSQLTYFAELLRDANLNVNQIKFITTGSENLHPHQAKKIKDYFGVDPKNHYGLAEGVANISQKPDSKLIIDQDFAYTELIPSEIPNVYHIIGTNYSNLAFPLIRYDTKDLLSANIVDNKLNILSIDGRSDDYIILPNGVKIGRLGHLFKNAVNVKEAQIYQQCLNKVIFRIVRNNSYNNEVDEKALLLEAYDRIGKDIKIEFEYLEEIPKTKSGKLKFVISEV